MKKTDNSIKVKCPLCEKIYDYTPTEEEENTGIETHIMLRIFCDVCKRSVYQKQEHIRHTINLYHSSRKGVKDDE